MTFLEDGLRGSDHAEKIRTNEQALSVSMSRVKTADARSLFLGAIWPTLRTSTRKSLPKRPRF
jgi:hypothetical protein